ATVEQDVAGVGIVEAVEEAEHGRLPRARRPDQGGEPLGGDAGGEPVDDGPVVAVDAHIAVLEAKRSTDRIVEGPLAFVDASGSHARPIGRAVRRSATAPMIAPAGNLGRRWPTSRCSSPTVPPS